MFPPAWPTWISAPAFPFVPTILNPSVSEPFMENVCVSVVTKFPPVPLMQELLSPLMVSVASTLPPLLKETTTSLERVSGALPSVITVSGCSG